SFLGVAAEQAEVFRRASLVGKSDFKNLEALILAALIYWALTAIFTFFQGRLEKRLSKGYVRTSAAAVAAVNAAAQSSGTAVTPMIAADDADGPPGGVR